VEATSPCGHSVYSSLVTFVLLCNCMEAVGDYLHVSAVTVQPIAYVTDSRICPLLFSMYMIFENILQRTYAKRARDLKWLGLSTSRA
jgi:hypothetical protein